MIALAGRRHELAGLLLVVVLGVYAAMTACRDVADPGAWQRLDLWMDRPLMDEEDRAIRRSVSALGPRDETLPPATGAVHVLRQRADTRMTKRLRLGEEPFFEFLPLSPVRRPVPVVFRVSVRDQGGAIEELLAVGGGGRVARAPSRVWVDLGRFSGQEVDLILEVELVDRAEPVRAFGLWGSPAVWWRGAAEVAPETSIARASDRPNILLIGADTLRADHLGAYGHSPSLTPALDRLAEESDVWLEAFSTFNATIPSFASILTGLYGKNHGVHSNSMALPEERTTLAELLSTAGYQTSAWIAARHLGEAGLGQGFDELYVSKSTDRGELPVDLLIDSLSRRREPFFAWLHLFDPHMPHTPPEPYSLGRRAAAPYGVGPVAEWTEFREPGPREYATRRGGHGDLYAGEVAYLDRQVDRLLGLLEDRGLLESTIIVFVADHGENLGEYGLPFWHEGLWDTTTHVPMMIRWPGVRRKARERGRRIPGLVQTIDLFPTLLAAAGVEVPDAVDGRDLDQLAQLRPPGRTRIFVEHANERGAMVRNQRHLLFVSDGVPRVSDGSYLYDLASDPGQIENIADQAPEVKDRLAELLTVWLADTPHAAPGVVRDLDDEAARRLEALGYIDR